MTKTYKYIEWDDDVGSQTFDTKQLPQNTTTQHISDENPMALENINQQNKASTNDLNSTNQNSREAVDNGGQQSTSQEDLSHRVNFWLKNYKYVAYICYEVIHTLDPESELSLIYYLSQFGMKGRGLPKNILNDPKKVVQLVGAYFKQNIAYIDKLNINIKNIERYFLYKHGNQAPRKFKITYEDLAVSEIEKKNYQSINVEFKLKWVVETKQTDPNNIKVYRDEVPEKTDEKSDYYAFYCYEPQ